MKGNKIGRITHGSFIDGDKIRRQEAKSIQKENRHFQKVSSGFHLMGLLIMMGTFMSSLFHGIFGGFGTHQVDTTEGKTAAQSRVSGIVHNRVTREENKIRYTKYYKMDIPKSIRKGLSFEELQLLRKALFPKFKKSGVQMVNTYLSHDEMMDIRKQVIGS